MKWVLMHKSPCRNESFRYHKTLGCFSYNSLCLPTWKALLALLWHEQTKLENTSGYNSIFLEEVYVSAAGPMSCALLRILGALYAIKANFLSSVSHVFCLMGFSELDDQKTPSSSESKLEIKLPLGSYQSEAT